MKKEPRKFFQREINSFDVKLIILAWQL